MNKQPYRFVVDDRLGIALPELLKDWDEFSPQEKELILSDWEEIRGKIPDRIHELEKLINQKQEQLNTEDNFMESCKLNGQIAELASTINDLHLWFRAQQDIDTKQHQG